MYHCYFTAERCVNNKKHTIFTFDDLNFEMNANSDMSLDLSGISGFTSINSGISGISSFDSGLSLSSNEISSNDSSMINIEFNGESNTIRPSRSSSIFSDNYNLLFDIIKLDFYIVDNDIGDIIDSISN